MRKFLSAAVVVVLFMLVGAQSPSTPHTALAATAAPTRAADAPPQQATQQDTIAADGTLETGIERLVQAKFFHFTYDNGEMQVEGNATTMGDNMQFTVKYTGKEAKLKNAIEGEWIILSTSPSGDTDLRIYHKFGDAWKLVDEKSADVDTALAMLALAAGPMLDMPMEIGNLSLLSIDINDFKKGTAEKIGDQETTRYTYTGDDKSTTDVWLSKTGDVVQLKISPAPDTSTATADASKMSQKVVTMQFSKLNVPVTIAEPK